MEDTINKILKDNEKKIEGIKPKKFIPPPPPAPPPPPKEPEIILEPEIIKVNYKSKILEAKKEYLANRDIVPITLAKRYNIDPIELQKIIKDENWDKQRLDLYVRADEKARQIMASTLAEVKGRHILISKMLQKIGKTNLRKIKGGDLSARETLAYITEGVKMEREVHGMNQQSPKIVNIIGTQQKIISKYKEKK